MHQEEKRGQKRLGLGTTGQSFTQDGDKRRTREKDKRSRLQRQKNVKEATERDSETCQQLLKVIA